MLSLAHAHTHTCHTRRRARNSLLLQLSSLRASCGVIGLEMACALKFLLIFFQKGKIQKCKSEFLCATIVVSWWQSCSAVTQRPFAIPGVHWHGVGHVKLFGCVCVLCFMVYILSRDVHINEQINKNINDINVNSVAVSYVI